METEKCNCHNKNEEPKDTFIEEKLTQWEDSLLAICFGVLEENMPKSLEASALGMEKIYRAFVPAFKVALKEQEERIRGEILEKIEGKEKLFNGDDEQGYICECEDYNEALQDIKNIIMRG